MNAPALLVGEGLFVYIRAGADLLAATDAGLRSRAEILAADVRANGPALANVGAELIERDEAFVQVLSASGAIEQSSTIVKQAPMLSAAVVAGVTGPATFERRIAGIDDVTRILAVPIDAGGSRTVLLVGTSLQDRRDQMLQLAWTLTIGGMIALVLIAFAGWLLAGAALRPVERMRRDAASISTEDLGRRLTLPDADDEIGRLARTLNGMLDRLAASFARERRVLDNASHELRNPLAVLKAELDLAASRERSADELRAALRSAREETDHLVRLADDLLVLARAQEGRLPIHRVPTSLDGFLRAAVDHGRPRAAESGVRLEVVTPAGEVNVDPVRFRQAVDDLLDNALRHTPRGGSILISGRRDDGVVSVTVQDSGPGFPPDFLPQAFEPFSRGSNGDEAERTGLGLSIVRAIAEAHGGSWRRPTQRRAAPPSR